MAVLQAKGLDRAFFIQSKDNEKSITLPDPGVHMSADEVMDFYSSQYPELTNSTVKGPIIQNDQQEFFFQTTVGLKG